MIRAEPLIAPDTPLADRWQKLGEDIERHGRAIDAALAAHRADCFSRYGYDFRHSDFTAGPAIHAVEAASRETKA